MVNLSERRITLPKESCPWSPGASEEEVAPRLAPPEGRREGGRAPGERGRETIAHAQNKQKERTALAEKRPARSARRRLLSRP